MQQMNRIAGGLCVVAGLGLGSIAWLQMPVGSLSRIGPGFFPVSIGAGLVFVGLAIAVFEKNLEGVRPPQQIRLQLRPVSFVMLAIVLFALLINPAGLVPTTIVASFMASFAMSDIPLHARIAVSLAVAAICTAIFGYGLRLPVEMFGN